MKIINTREKLSFRSGLTKSILKKEKQTIPYIKSLFFEKTLGVETQFLNNPSYAYSTELCFNIFKKLNQNLNLPPCIIFYHMQDLINEKQNGNFCIPDTKEILKNEYPFPGRSVFFQEFKNFETINEIVENKFNKNEISSSHFLAPLIHEWIHSIQIDYIYSKFGYGGNCDYLKQLYPIKTTKINGYNLIKKLQTTCLSKEENEIIQNILGSYSTTKQNQFLEVLSETFTKFICDSLHGTKLIKNPFDMIKSTPKEFQKILKKVSFFI